jgi:hypothetical protein
MNKCLSMAILCHALGTFARRTVDQELPRIKKKRMMMKK